MRLKVELPGTKDLCIGELGAAIDEAEAHGGIRDDGLFGHAVAVPDGVSIQEDVSSDQPHIEGDEPMCTPSSARVGPRIPDRRGRTVIAPGSERGGAKVARYGPAQPEFRASVQIGPYVPEGQARVADRVEPKAGVRVVQVGSFALVFPDKDGPGSLRSW